MAKTISILGKTVGEGHPALIIAEAGLNHNGDVALAKKLIDQAVEAGCDVVKFQKRDVPNLSTESFLNSADTRFPEFGNTYREIREHVEFNEEEYRELIAYANEKGIPFLCTPFDIPSAKFLEKLDMPAYKIASHCVTLTPLLEYIAAQKKPVIMSTGMTKLEEIDRAVEIFKKHDCPLIILQCVSSYPTAAELINLKAIDFLRDRYDVPVGYSGHEDLSLGHMPTLGAIFRGACVVERHITQANDLVGFDHKLSVTPTGLKDMVKDIRLAEKMLGSGEKKLLPEELIKREQQIFCIVSASDIKAGDTITKDMITYKGPGTGLPAYHTDDIVGKTAAADIPADTTVSMEMFK